MSNDLVKYKSSKDIINMNKPTSIQNNMSNQTLNSEVIHEFSDNSLYNNSEERDCMDINNDINKFDKRPLKPNKLSYDYEN